MKIILSPDSFKGTLSADQAARAMEQGMKQILPDAEYIRLPIADGGEGTLDVLVDLTKGEIHYVEVLDPLSRPVEARYGILGDGKTAVIEMAEASGIMRVAVNEQDPYQASTYGTGQLIRHALDQGCRSFIVAIGGSATNDGGIGVMRALGAAFYTKDEVALDTYLPDYAHLQRIDLSEFDSRIADCEFSIACDVDNPLLGVRGATAIFGPQKGVREKHAQVLESVLAHYAEILEVTTGKRLHDHPGAGAAGGLGAALLAFFPAELKRGIDIVLDAIGFTSLLTDADWVVTGEGKSDQQTLSGKAPLGVAERAARARVPAILLSGIIQPEDKQELEKHFHFTQSVVSECCTIQQALENPEQSVREAAQEIARYIMGESKTN